MLHFTQQHVLDNHEVVCKNHEAHRAVYPNKGDTLKFKWVSHQLPLPWFAAVDIETVAEPIPNVHDERVSNTSKLRTQKALCCMFKVVSSLPGFFRPGQLFKGPNCVSEMLDALNKEAGHLLKIIKRQIGMSLTEEEEVQFQLSTHCHICGRGKEEEEEFVRDHCHLTGTFRGAAHNECNMKYNLQVENFKLNIFAHNMTGFDSHLILSAIDPKRHGNIKCIPRTEERYVSFSAGRKVFKDSLNFIDGSLDEIVKSLPDESLSITRQYIEQRLISDDKYVIVHNIGGEASNEEIPREPSEAVNDLDGNGDGVDCGVPRREEEKCVKLKRKRKRKTPVMVYDEEDVDEDDDGDDGDEGIDDEEENEDDRCFIDDCVGDEGEEAGDHLLENPSDYNRLDNVGEKGRKITVEVKKSAKGEKTVIYKSIRDLPEDDFRRNPHQASILPMRLNEKADRQFKLSRRKGFLNYDDLTSFSELDATSLPSEPWYNMLNDTTISNEQYHQAKEVWEEFECETMWDYCEHYLITDVLLLADVLLNFQKACLRDYKIDPLQCYTLPGFAFEAALKMGNLELELISDPDMHMFVERGIRGGSSVVCQRYAKANIPDTTDYDPAKPASHIIYWDANNQYGWAMSQCLPISGFKWREPSGDLERDLNHFVVNREDDADEGCILEIDAEYPNELHDEHNDYPLAPEHLTIDTEMLSEEQQQMIQNHCSYKKLVQNLGNKRNYILHYRNLKTYIKMGLNVTKIHRVLEFKQLKWLKDYIDFNTAKRAAAAFPFEVALYKKMNNAVFGKTMENVRKHRTFQFVQSEEELKKLATKANFKGFRFIRPDLILVERRKTTIKFFKPISSGFSILDVSKLLLYVENEYIKQRYPGSRSKLLFTDTDSLAYLIETDDIYKDMIEERDRYDFSDYPDNHPCFSNLPMREIQQIKQQNKKVLGKFKDELNGFSINEWVGVRAKVYSFTIHRDQENDFLEYKKIKGDICTKKLKGVKRSIVKNKITHEHYKQCVLENKSKSATFISFRSFQHQLYTIKQTKTALVNFDDKRFMLPGGVETLAHGHYRINEERR